MMTSKHLVLYRHVYTCIVFKWRMYNYSVYKMKYRVIINNYNNYVTINAHKEIISAFSKALAILFCSLMIRLSIMNDYKPFYI